MRLINLVSPITILLARVGYLPLTSMLILDRTNPRRSILQIKCEYWPEKIRELNTLSSQEKSAHALLIGGGFATEVLTRTTRTYILVSQRKAKQMAASSKHLSSAAKPFIYALGAFLAAWQATDFSYDARAVLGALTACVLGYASPKKK